MKIKDGVDLKELEKFGFRYSHTIFAIAELERYVKRVRQSRVHLFIYIDVKTRKISIINNLEIKPPKLEDLIQDLIQANLVEE